MAGPKFTLPKRVVIHHDTFFYVQELEERYASGRPKPKFHRLCRVEEGTEAMEAALKALLGEGRAPAASMCGAIADFLKSKRGELTPMVFKEYARMFDVIGKSFREYDVGEVVPKMVLNFLKAFAGHPTTRRAYKARLATFFSWAVIQEYCKVNPCREIKLKAPPKRARKMTPQLYHAIRDRLPPIGQCFLDLSFLTCQRPTEIRLLKESQISEDGIRFRPSKTNDTSGAEVTWPLTPEIVAVLDRARKLNKLTALRGDCYLIQSKYGSPYTKTGLNSVWRRALIRAGMPSGITTRDIRPFALSTAEKMGYRLEDLRKAAAHTTVGTTEGYLAQYGQVVSPVHMILPPTK